MSQQKPELTPACITPRSHSNSSTPERFDFSGFRVETRRHHQNTFEVAPKHVPLTGPTPGVRFNVETLPEPLPEDRHKPRLSRAQQLDEIRTSIFQEYSEDMRKKYYFSAEDVPIGAGDVRIEATSEHDANLIYRGGNGFIVAVLTAFAQHLPLELSPDHIWALITYAFAKHVDENAEELRHLLLNTKVRSGS